MTTAARKEMGFLLRLVQDGEALSMPQSRPMPDIGAVRTAVARLPQEGRKMKEIGKGWVEGSAQELLGLTDAEAAYIETKAVLTRAVRERRLALGLSQASMAKALGTSQSRFSFIERDDPSVSIDLALRALFETGVDMRGVAALMAGETVPKASPEPCCAVREGAKLGGRVSPRAAF
jgi:DNA-binding XRE family transcriptional regulator